MSANMQVIEHRWGDRVVLDAPTEFRTTHGMSLDGVIGNASLSGAYVRTRSRPPLLSCVALRPLNALGEWLEACVVRHDETGVGLEWLDPGLRSVSALLAMGRDTPQPAALADTGSWMRRPARTEPLIPA